MSISQNEPKYKVGDGFKSKRSELRVIVTEISVQRGCEDPIIYACNDGLSDFYFGQCYLDTYFDSEVVDEKSSYEIALQSLIKKCAQEMAEELDKILDKNERSDPGAPDCEAVNGPSEEYSHLLAESYVILPGAAGAKLIK